MSGLTDEVLSSFTAENLAKAPRRREIYTFVIDAVETVATEMKALHARIDELEKSGARFRGVYQRAAVYRRGDQTTHKGSLWTALGDVPEGAVPGDNPSHWQLAAKGTG